MKQTLWSDHYQTLSMKQELQKFLVGQPEKRRKMRSAHGGLQVDKKQLLM